MSESSGVQNDMSWIRIEHHVNTRITSKHALPRAIFAVIDQLPAETRSSHYFDDDLEAQIAISTRDVEIWLAHTEPLVQQGLAEAAQTIATGHLDIREYFRPADIPPPPD
jgi:hypothetical protein